MTKITRVVVGALFLVLSGSLGFSQENDAEEEIVVIEEVVEIDASDFPLAAEEACFGVRDVRNFDAIDDRFVYVEGRRDEHYLLTMFTHCFGLRNAFGIAISNSFNRVCSNNSARITYRDFGRLQTCRIGTVEAVADKEAAEQIVELRKQQD